MPTTLSYAALRQHRFQAAGLCRICGKVPPLPDKTRCAACIETSRAFAAKRPAQTPQQKQRLRATQRRLHAHRKAAGLCTACGQQPADKPALACARCRVIRAANSRARRSKDPAHTRLQARQGHGLLRQRRIAAGCCVRCGKKPLRTTRVCERCYEQTTARKHRPDVRAWTAIYQRDRHQRLRAQVIDHYTGGTRRCMCPGCNTTGLEFLTLDHVRNDGKQHRTTAGVGIKFFCWCIASNYPPRIQVLCWNCNAAKHFYGNGTCPCHGIQHDEATLAVLRKPSSYKPSSTAPG